ncbi:MAG TPA: hypothetical protein VGA16_08535 [Candidatus Limnocylindria bacterium]
MTQRTVGSFLIRVEAADDGSRDGIVTSVQTGERAPFAGFADLVRILERWAGTSGRLSTEEEKT